MSNVSKPLKYFPSNKAKTIIETELDEACTEIDNLLRIVHQLEKDKSILNARLNNIGVTSSIYDAKNCENISTTLLTKYCIFLS